MLHAEVDSGSLKTLSVGDIAGDFYIPSYQRGYRWGEQEVLQLLEDMRESNGATYYLQPVVVKGRGDGSWELIDGQQRLTTLYLIFRYLKSAHLPSAAINYSLTYETRGGSKAYLDRLDEGEARTNIDFFHMFNAYKCIEAWFERFEHRVTHEATSMYGHLFDGVKVLWYEAPPEVDSRDLFTRLNVGRIPLTDAELVKAQLLSHGQAGEGQTDRALEISAHWDLIERDLRAPGVWAFVTGRAEEDPTHISLLLDALAGGRRGHDTPLFQTFETLRGRIESDAQEFWRSVVDLHSLVLGWYDDRDLFHKVGYLIAVGRTFEEIVELSRDKGRSAFEADLDAKIRSHLRLSAGDLTDLSYSSSKTSDVLLLMNVETIRRMQDSSERYSFKAHAASEWTLEHIHAQNAEGLTTVEQWRAWLEFHKGALDGLPGLDDDRRTALVGRIDEVLFAQVTQQMFSALEKDLTALFSADDGSDDEQTHSISNLALLGNKDNSALSNSVFEVKRREIIRRDKLGSYIPACTRNVFLKYYARAGDEQLHFWSAADRESYVEAIKEAVAPYLETEEVQAS
jgi:hypothetical protein